MTLDPRINAVRADLADIRLGREVSVPRYAEGRPARVVAGLVPVRKTPNEDSPLDTFFHYGEAVRVFDESGGYAWCQSGRDRYVGYVEASSLREGNPPKPTHYIAGVGAYRYTEADLRSPAIDFLPRHAPVAVAQAGFVCRDTAYAWLNGGGFLPEACLSTSPPHSADLAAAASLYIGCPYLWAGRSFLGLDCSGLVQEAFRDLGQSVPRDTDMQREAIGEVVAVAQIADLRRNDLIFMPAHVMIYAGEGTVIHAFGGGMSVRRDSLAELLKGWSQELADFTVRRPG
jgi:cell wall-associated NlpC family hydrolase